MKISKSGVDAIPVSSTLTITGYITNPQEYPIVTTIGDASSTNAGIMVSNSAVKDKTKLIAHDLTMLKVRLDAAEESLEHTTFTVNMKALRSETLTDTDVVMGVTFQYNTPPGTPIPVTKTDSGYAITKEGEQWKGADDGNLYWAWDDTETDEKSPKHAKWFNVDGNLLTLDECKVTGAEVDDYSVFSAKIDSTSASISVAAVDSEEIVGSAISTIESGQIVPTTYITSSNVSDVIAGLPGDGPHSLEATGEWSDLSAIKTALEKNSTKKVNLDLSNVTNLTSIGDRAFYGCSSLTNITIPSSVTSIGDWAFKECSSLATLRIEAENPPSLGIDVFTSVSSNLEIQVPSGYLDAYQNAENWRDYAHKIVEY